MKNLDYCCRCCCMSSAKGPECVHSNKYAMQGTLQPTALLSILFGVTALCGLACMLAESCSVKKAKKLLRQFCLLATGVYLMSPLQQTLTRSVSRWAAPSSHCSLSDRLSIYGHLSCCRLHLQSANLRSTVMHSVICNMSSLPLLSSA